MKNKGMKIKHPKLRGEVGGVAFYDMRGRAWALRDQAVGRDGALRLCGGTRRAFCAGAGEVNNVQRSRWLLVQGAGLPWSVRGGSVRRSACCSDYWWHDVIRLCG